MELQVPDDPIEQTIEQLFTYHPATPEQAVAYAQIRTQAKELVRVILETAPAGVDRAYAVRAVRTAVMYANAAIATDNAFDSFTQREVMLSRTLGAGPPIDWDATETAGGGA